MLNKYYLCAAFSLHVSRTFLTQRFGFFSKLVTTVWLFFLKKKESYNYELQVRGIEESI